MDCDLLRIVGRSEELGRPLKYGTTKRFLAVFGLCSLDQLPWASELRRSSAAALEDSEKMSVFADSDDGLTRDIDAA
jgi:segregation and condensation protein B